jgi:hypothetical protein
MKKTLFPFLLLALGTILAGPAFAEEYTVESVTGKAEWEIAPGKWKALARGMILAPAALINTGLNAQLVLNTGDKSVIIGAARKGTVEALADGLSDSEVRIGEKETEAGNGGDAVNFSGK